MVTRLGSGAATVVSALSHLTAEKRVTNVVLRTRTHRSVVAIPIVTRRAVSVDSAWIRVAVVRCMGEMIVVEEQVWREETVKRRDGKNDR